MMIQALAKRGVYQRDIAEQLGVHPKTVSRALAQGEQERPPARRGSLVEPCCPQIDALLQEGVWNVVVIWR